MPGFGAMHVFIAALIRTISQYPGMNRFISGLRLFARIKPVYHHLYDFGNVSMFISFSATRHEKVFAKDGTEQTKRFFDFTFVCDERICDGHYFATAFKALKKYLEHPEELNERPKEIIEDID